MLPNWIIAGAPKSGTTSLFQWLVDHPEVDGSRQKETYYFSDPGTHMYRYESSFHSKGIVGYGELFAHCSPSSKAIIESTPGYMYSRTALEELPDLQSRPNFVFLLREPVEQIKSLFNYFQNNWGWIGPNVTFRTFITELDRGAQNFSGNELARHALGNANYGEHLRRWRDACGAERIHVFLFEDMISRKREFMMTLARTMNIDPRFYQDYHYPSENGSYAVRSRMLQSINLKLRGVLPKGSAYELMRRCYRALNTAPAPAWKTLDLDIEQLLSRRYASLSGELAREFGVETTSWEKISAARLRHPRRNFRTADAALRYRSEEGRAGPQTASGKEE